MSSDSPMPFRENASILILEHTQNGQDVLSDFLQEADLSYAFLKDLEQLRDVLSTATPSLILFDLDAPGTDATAFVNVLRIYGKQSIPLVGLTAGDIEDVQYTCFEAGVDAILSKPVKKVELAGIVTIFMPA